MRETWVRSLGWEHPLEKEMQCMHSRTIAWKISWTEEPGRLQPMRSQRVRHDWMTKHSTQHPSTKLTFCLFPQHCTHTCTLLDDYLMIPLLLFYLLFPSFSRPLSLRGTVFLIHFFCLRYRTVLVPGRLCWMYEWMNLKWEQDTHALTYGHL